MASASVLAIVAALSLIMLSLAAEPPEWPSDSDWQAPAVKGRSLQQAVPVTPLTAPVIPPVSPARAAPPLTALPPPSTPCQDIAPPAGTGGPLLSPSPSAANPAQSAVEALMPNNPAVGEVGALLNAVGRRLTAVQYSCAQQKGFGQCNAAFMQPQLGRASYCATTCGRCT